MTLIINGRQEAYRLKESLRPELEHLAEKGITPGLAVVLVGNDSASQIYVASKCQQALDIGIHSVKKELSSDIDESILIEHIHELNRDPLIHGILVQLPLPKHLNTQKILREIDPLKDVDGLHPFNMGLLMSGHPYLVPCTPLGCLRLIKTVRADLTGLKAVIVGASLLVGRPLAQMLLNEKCSVTVTHSKTRHIEQECASADILIAAAGVPHLVKANWVKKGAIVLDVGITRISDDYGNTQVVGDVDFEAIKHDVAAITPVPGGVGPMTVACLLENTIKAAQKIHDIRPTINL